MTPTQQRHSPLRNEFLFRERQQWDARTGDRCVSESQVKRISNGRLLENQLTPSGLSYEKNEAGRPRDGWTRRALIVAKGRQSALYYSGIVQLPL